MNDSERRQAKQPYVYACMCMCVSTVHVSILLSSNDIIDPPCPRLDSCNDHSRGPLVTSFTATSLVWRCKLVLVWRYRDVPPIPLSSNSIPFCIQGLELHPQQVSPDIKPEKLIEHLCVHFGLLGEVDDRTPSGWSSGLGHAVMTTELCKPLKLKLSGGHTPKPWEEEGKKVVASSCQVSPNTVSCVLTHISSHLHISIPTCTYHTSPRLLISHIYAHACMPTHPTPTHYTHLHTHTSPFMTQLVCQLWVYYMQQMATTKL